MDLPFLYLTRTILRPGQASTRPSRILSIPKTRFRCVHQASQDDTRDPTSFFRQKAEAVAAKLGPRETSTITREEQRAFQNLRRLADQVQRSRHKPDVSPDTNLLNVDHQAILALFTPTAASHSGNDAQVSRICEEYMTTVSSDFKDALRSDPSRGDLGIWKVLRCRVFPLLSFLKDREQVSHSEQHAAEIALPIAKSLFRATEPQPVSDTSAKPHPQPEESMPKDEPVVSMPSSSASAIPPGTPSISPLPILTRIYPASLLLAIRLLTKHYPVSTLTPSLLPGIRALGSSSYVLGTNTHFYNTYLLLRWNTHSSLREVCSLLSEMERGAVEFDRGTYRVLQEVADERWGDLIHQDLQVYPISENVGEANLVSRGAKWWLRQEQVQWWPKVESWKNIVGKKLEERGLGQVLREGPTTRVPVLPETEQKSAEVWL